MEQQTAEKEGTPAGKKTERKEDGFLGFANVPSPRYFFIVVIIKKLAAGSPFQPTGRSLIFGKTTSFSSAFKGLDVLVALMKSLAGFPTRP